MFNKSIGLVLGFSLLAAAGCSNEGDSPAFLATSASGNGDVTIAGFKGVAAPGTNVKIANESLGLYTSATTGSDGSLLASIPGESGDTFKIEYTDDAGNTQSEEVESQPDLLSFHGLLTVIDPDGDDGDERLCVQLHRDDVDPDAEDALLRIVPPRHEDKQGPPPEDGEGQPPPEDGEGQPPPEDGEGQPPPEGEGECHHGDAPPPDIEAMDNTTVTVVGHFVEPKEEGEGDSCAGIPFEGHNIISDEEGGDLTMEGSVEKISMNEGEMEIECWTFQRRDVVDEFGNVPEELLGVYELTGDQMSVLGEDSASVQVKTMYFQGEGQCGFSPLKVSGLKVQ